MGIIRILKRALRPNKRREAGNKTGLVGPSFKRKVEGEIEINEPQHKYEMVAAVALALVVVATVFLLINIDSKAIITNRNDP